MSTSTIKLRNVLKQQQAIGQKISQIITISDSNKFKTIHQKIIQCTIEIEAICAKNQLTPAALSKPSRKVYAWMKFLSHEDNFTLHLNAICRARAIAREIIKTNKTEVETVIVELTNFSGLYKYKITNKQAKEHGRITTGEIERYTQANRSTIKARINDLLGMKKLIRHGKGRSTWYSLF